MATPNMTLVLPVEDGSSGTWDTLLNEAMERIDLHDHTSGLGVPIPTAGISLDADLPYGGYAATGVKAIDFNAVATIAAGYLTSLFVDSGDGELYWRTAGGVNVQLTDGNTLNAASLGGITGDYGTGDEEVSYSSSSFIYNFLRDDSPLRRAFIDTADIRLFESANGITNAVKLISPTALAASYTITFPTALPGSTSLMLMSAAGVISTSRTPTIDTLTTTGDVAVGGALGSAGLITATAGLTAAANQHITVSGTGRIKHGARSITVSGGAGFGTGFTVDGADAVAELNATADRLYYDAPLMAGLRLVSVDARVTDNSTGATKVTAELFTGGSSLASTGISDTSAGDGTTQTLTLPAIDDTIVAGERWTVRCSIDAANDCTVNWVTFHYDDV